MSAAALRSDPLLPPRSERLGVGAVLALAAHGLLILALALGVSWNVGAPEPVTAELWAAVPQIAAPPAAEPEPVKEPPKPQPTPPQPVKQTPPPQPVERDADIAIEKAKKEKARREEQERLAEEQARRERLEREKQAREKAEREKAEKAEKAEKERLAKEEADKQKRKKEEEARLAKLREENLKRMMGQVGGTGDPTSAGRDARNAGPSASYAGKIIGAIRPNIVSINEFEGNPEAIVGLRAAPDGTILSRRLIKPSGDKDWDEEVLRAIDRTARLPRDENGRVPPDIELKMRPKVGG